MATANQYLARYWFAVATVKIVHRSEIHHKSSPPRGWDGCTFVGADLRVYDLWVRSRSLAATRGRSGLHSTPGLASTVRTVPGNTPGSHGPGNPPGFTMIHPFPTLGFDSAGTRFLMNRPTGEEKEEEEEDLFVFNDTIEGPRAPAVKPGRITQA